MTINKIFRPKFEYYLKRIGKRNDGGYLVGLDSIKKTKTLISYGINDDWSFEKDFYEINDKINIISFDDQLNITFLFKKMIINFLKIFIP